MPTSMGTEPASASDKAGAPDPAARGGCRRRAAGSTARIKRHPGPPSRRTASCTRSNPRARSRRGAPSTSARMRRNCPARCSRPSRSNAHSRARRRSRAAARPRTGSPVGGRTRLRRAKGRNRSAPRRPRRPTPPRRPIPPRPCLPGRNPPRRMRTRDSSTPAERASQPCRRCSGHLEHASMDQPAGVSRVGPNSAGSNRDAAAARSASTRRTASPEILFRVDSMPARRRAPPPAGPRRDALARAPRRSGRIRAPRRWDPECWMGGV